jgi:hypothetical protein
MRTVQNNVNNTIFKVQGFRIELYFIECPPLDSAYILHLYLHCFHTIKEYLYILILFFTNLILSVCSIFLSEKPQYLVVNSFYIWEHQLLNSNVDLDLNFD